MTKVRRAASSASTFSTIGTSLAASCSSLGASAKCRNQKVQFDPKALVVPVPGFCPARLPQSKGLRALWHDGDGDFQDRAGITTGECCTYKLDIDEEEEEEETPKSINNATLDESPSPRLDEECTRLFAAAAARANFLSMDRPDVSFAAKELCRRMAAPRVSDLQALRRLVRYLLGAPRLVMHYRWQTVRHAIDVYADTDFAGCTETRKSTSGGCAMLGAHCIKHWSATQKSVTLSSGEAELVGVVKATGEALGLQSLAADLGGSLRVRVHADSSAAIGICNRTGVGRVRHLAVGQLWVQSKVRDKSIELIKVHGLVNPADLFTKHLGKEPLHKCLALLGATFEAGRPVLAPKVTADIVRFLEPGFVTDEGVRAKRHRAQRE